VAELVLQLAARAGVAAPVITPPDIRAGVLSTPDGRHVLIAINTADGERAGSVELPGLTHTRCEDLIAGGSSSLALRFAPYESKVLLLREV
jgi:hypothetical protein